MTTPFNPPSTVVAGLRGRCPRCGEGRLFRSYLKIADHCDRCELDYGFADPADGPAFFVMTIVGVAVITAWGVWAALWQPPIWAQMVVVFPALIFGCLASLPPMKAWLVAEQYVHKAEEGRFLSLGAHGKAPQGYNPRGW